MKVSDSCLTCHKVGSNWKWCFVHFMLSIEVVMTPSTLYPLWACRMLCNHSIHGAGQCSLGDSQVMVASVFLGWNLCFLMEETVFRNYSSSQTEWVWFYIINYVWIVPIDSMLFLGTDSRVLPWNVYFLSVALKCHERTVSWDPTERFCENTHISVWFFLFLYSISWNWHCCAGRHLKQVQKCLIMLAGEECWKVHLLVNQNWAFWWC